MRAAEQLRYLVLAAQREGNRQLLRALAPLGLTPSQAEVLRILGDHAPLTLSALGDLLVCESGTNPSRLADRLVTAGLVERTTGAADRRQISLTLSEAGRALDAKVRTIESDLYASVDTALAGVDAEAVVEVLRRLTAGSPSGRAFDNRVAAGAS